MDLGGVLILVLEQPRLKEWIAATRGVSMAYSRSKAWYMVVRKLERVTEKNANTDADEGGCKLQTIMGMATTRTQYQCAFADTTKYLARFPLNALNAAPPQYPKSNSFIES